MSESRMKRCLCRKDKFTNKVLFVKVVVLLVPFLVNAQVRTVKSNMIWAGYYNSVNLNKKWSVNSDLQFRTRHWTREISQAVIRSGLSYKMNDHFSVTGGFAYLSTAQYLPEKLVMKNEYRPWLEFAYQDSYKKTRFNHRLRLEERFLQQLQSGEKSHVYEKLFRVRYKIDAQFRLKGTLNFVVANEVMFHPGYISDNRFFDQNRASVALNLKVSEPLSLQWQYMKIYQSRNRATILEDQDVFRFLVYHTINFKK